MGARTYIAVLIAALVHLPLWAEPAARAVAFTFDDLPATHGGLQHMRGVNTSLIEALKKHRVPAIGFVNEGKLFVGGEVDQRTALLRAWLDAGLTLGNHTYSHIAIDGATIEQYKEDVIRGASPALVTMAMVEPTTAARLRLHLNQLEENPLRTCRRP